MSLYTTISEGIKDAMRAKDKDRLSVLRDIKSKLMLEASKTGADGDSIEDATAMAILNKLFKQRTETAAIYAEQGRADLEAEERIQAAVIESFLPQQLSPDEIETRVKAILTDINATSMADMGRAMGAASASMAGQADGKLIATFVKAALQNK
jgi:uncharacterized protein YqeY